MVLAYGTAHAAIEQPPLFYLYSAGPIKLEAVLVSLCYTYWYSDDLVYSEYKCLVYVVIVLKVFLLIYNSLCQSQRGTMFRRVRQRKERKLSNALLGLTERNLH